MASTLTSFPRVDVWRTTDGSYYTLMDFVLVEPGHFISYGELLRLTRSEAAAVAWNHVRASLDAFAIRNGNDKSRQLKLQAGEPASFGTGRVSIRQVSATAIELTAYERGKRPLDALRFAFKLPTTAEAFFDALEEAFARGAAVSE